MTAPYICASCRASLSLSSIRGVRRIAYTASQRQTTRTRQSNDAGVLNGSDPRTRSAEYGGERGVIRGRYSGKELRPEDLLNQLDGLWRAPGPEREAHPHNLAQPEIADGPDQFVQDNRTPRRRTGPATTRRPVIPPGVEVKVKAFADCCDATDFGKAWDTLRELAPQIPSEVVNSLFTPRFTKSLNLLTAECTDQWLARLAAKKDDPVPRQLPHPLEVFRILYDLEALTLFRAPLWQAASGIMDLRVAGIENGKLATAVQELASMWRICIARRLLRPSQDSDKPDPQATSRTIADDSDWSFLPSPSLFASLPSERRSHDDFRDLLAMLVPSTGQKDFLQADKSSPRSSQPDYVSAVLVSLDLLRSVSVLQAGGNIHPVSELPTCAPFVKILETLLQICPGPALSDQLQIKLSRTKDEMLAEEYRQLALRMRVHDKRLAAPMVAPKARYSKRDAQDGLYKTRSMPASDVEEFASLNWQRIQRAVDRQDLNFLRRLRMEILAVAGSHQNKKTALPLELFEALMTAFLSLRSEKDAVEMWSYIIQAGYRPTAKTYTAMMKGCSKLRDINGAEAFWQKMRNDGIQPDEHAWSTRVFVLLSNRREPDRGLQVLREMGQEWYNAAKAKYARELGAKKIAAIPSNKLTSQILARYQGPVDGVPRPDVTTMNAAISALANNNDKHIPQVLAWGRSFGLGLDIVTYNALLSLSMRQGRATEALDLLKRMKEEGVDATSTTWAIILSALFEGGSLDKLDHAQQEQKILAFMNSLERINGECPIDDKGFALTINHLLKRYNNYAAATAVLHYMINSGHEPNSSIYTILMTYYFQREPKADLEAVEALWARISTANNGWGAQVDSIFYDRMVEGYASNHRYVGLQPAINFLKRQRHAGMRTGWKALEALARAYAECKKWTRLKLLVREVRHSTRDARSFKFGQANFWDFILETGILRQQGIFVKEQLMDESNWDNEKWETSEIHDHASSEVE